MEYELPCEGELLDDFDGLACPPLDDLDALFAETTTFDPFTLFDGVGVDVHAMATMEKKKPVTPPLPKRCFGKGKELKTLLQVLKPPSCYQENLNKDDLERDHRQDWYDEERMARSKRKLHQGYQEYQNQRRKIQVLDIKDLPKPAKPQRGNVIKNKLLKSRKCLAF